MEETLDQYDHSLKNGTEANQHGNGDGSRALSVLTETLSTTQLLRESSVEACSAPETLATLAQAPRPSWWRGDLTLAERYSLCRSVAEECIQEEELWRLLALKPNAPVCYDGFEPSGRMHIAQGVQKALNVNKLTAVGCIFKFWIADYFAQLNNKLGGDLEKIRTVGRYFIEVWRACGMDMERVEFLWASEEIAKRPTEYWSLVMDIARRNSLARMIRCCQIMGRNESDELSAAQILYPCMQCADIFFLHADVCQLGMDQRKVNVLAREYCDMRKLRHKPVILSHRMMPGLKQGQEKMSKSDPDSAIFMEDSEIEVNTKIKKAFCPPGVLEGNPCLEYLQYMVLPKLGEFCVERHPEHGGTKRYTDFGQVARDYESGALHPSDLKPALARALNQILQPVRDHFEQNPEARSLRDKVRRYRSKA
ncbi:hypothetical protein CCYA_CCYA02G0668 [Cyanidiococcus yangmingshanensis]|uniref:tyrosine--tRNA ligase n=1 Tax=Cyanidiococcus yangmingshanensis TaxID=2690220 RepID=A0A7J7IP25_9RHOD|nr:hypothetical protein F1559_002443 [Cyanidiococcus yangmingshanensis]KAK4529811.1 hypothetical protein CCYA_CCYA02G0668 [Cyanidiococcus yangmingshanensis]